jgi:hypothetical protein
MIRTIIIRWHKFFFDFADDFRNNFGDLFDFQIVPAGIKNLLEDITKTLIEKETLEQEEFNVILVRHGITPKKKEEI